MFPQLLSVEKKNLENFYAKKVVNVVMVFGHVSFRRIKNNLLFFFVIFYNLVEKKT